MFEQLPGRHADYARANAFSLQPLISLHAELDFASRANDDQFRIGIAGQHVRPFGDARCRSVFGAVQCCAILTREYESDWIMAKLHNKSPALRDFIRVART